jgi:hypothetical protein
MGRLRRFRLPRHVLVLVLIAVLCGTGVALYLDERSSRQQVSEVGNPTAEDWVELDVTAQKADTGTQQVTLAVIVVPHGSLAQARDSLVFTRSVEITTQSLTTTSFRTPAGSAAPLQTIPVGMSGGTPTDYPFDHYSISVGWTATDRGTALPVALAFTDSDPFFVVRPTAGDTAGNQTYLDARVSRSRSTYILAWFVMAVMWALALAVLGGAEVLIRKRQGLVWPALGWMAATLFALVGLRNAAPGSPPIGSLMDYLAFFWAEGIIAASLACTVAIGIRTERRLMREAESAAS